MLLDWTGYIDRRMLELGHIHYYLRVRHFVLNSGQTIYTGDGDHYFFLLEPAEAVIVQSSFGYFDLTTYSSNELQYEHYGNTRMTNTAPALQHVRMMQVIPVSLSNTPCH